MPFRQKRLQAQLRRARRRYRKAKRSGSGAAMTAAGEEIYRIQLALRRVTGKIPAGGESSMAQNPRFHIHRRAGRIGVVRERGDRRRVEYRCRCGHPVFRWERKP